jgi:hypothetical protein
MGGFEVKMGVFELGSFFFEYFNRKNGVFEGCLIRKW